LLRQEGVQFASEQKTLPALFHDFRVEDRLLVLIQFADLGIGQALERRLIVVLGRQNRAGHVARTILPANLPVQPAKSLSLCMGATTTGADNAPLVAGVQAIGMPRSTSARGALIRTCDDSIHQPRPNSKASALTFKPQLLNLSWVQRSALRMAGELVMRPPI